MSRVRFWDIFHCGFKNVVTLILMTTSTDLCTDPRPMSECTNCSFYLNSKFSHKINDPKIHHLKINDLKVNDLKINDLKINGLKLMILKSQRQLHGDHKISLMVITKLVKGS